MVGSSLSSFTPGVLAPLGHEEQGRRSREGGGDSYGMHTPPGTGLGLSGPGRRPSLRGFLPPSSSPSKEECFLTLAGVWLLPR